MPLSATHTPFFTQLFDALEDAAFYLEAIRGGQGQLVDFVFQTGNKKGDEILWSVFAAKFGERMLGDKPERRAAYQTIFAQYAAVLYTGESQSFNFLSNQLGRLIHVTRSRMGDGILVVIREVEPRKETIPVAQNLTELLSGILEASLNGIITYQSIRSHTGEITDFSFVRFNQAARRMLRLSDDTVGKPMLEELPGVRESGLLKLFMDVVETGVPARFETPFKADDQEFWYDMSVVKLGDGFVITFNDITQNRVAQRVMERQAEELQTIIDTSQTGIFLLTPLKDKETGAITDFRIRLVNRLVADYMGRSQEKLVGIAISKHYPDYVTNGLFAVYCEAYRSGQPQHIDYGFQQDDMVRWLDIKATRMGEEVLVTFTDFTPLKRLQLQLEASVADLKRSNQNLEQFAYVASHDLQEPLRKIMSFGSILKEQYAGVIGEQGADLIRRMQSAATRMQALVKDVLAYSRISNRREATDWVNLETILSDVLDTLETALEAKEALVVRDPMPVVRGDAAQLLQLFQNLIGNALKFTKPGRRPELGLRTRMIRGREADFPVGSADLNRSFHCIDVCDNGIGFDEAQAEKIFQVFQRLHGRSAYEGTGIGLAIVKKVVENHEGYIHAFGKPGEGATFRVLLPVRN